MRPASVPIKPTSKPTPVPRKNTAPIPEEAATSTPPSRPPAVTPAKQQTPKLRPLIPPTRPLVETKDNNEEYYEKPKSVSEMIKLLEKR